MTETTETPTLEDSLKLIETLIHSMERGDLTLEQSLSSFERGVNLIKHCQKILNEADQKIQILMKTNGSDHLDNYENQEE